MSKLTLPRAFRTKWLKALRSGTYQQGTGVLHKVDIVNTDRYCCLGVAAKECGVPNEALRGEGIIDVLVEKKVIKSYSILAKNLRSDVGTKARQVFVQVLMTKNDEQVPFSEIATYIEQNTRPV